MYHCQDSTGGKTGQEPKRKSLVISNDSNDKAVLFREIKSLHYTDSLQSSYHVVRVLETGKGTSMVITVLESHYECSYFS